MYIKDRTECREIAALDGAALRELLNPRREAGLALGYSLAEARVKPGFETRPHRLKSSEVYYVLEGRGRMRVEREKQDLAAGQAVYIPPGSVQSIKNTGRRELVFLCLVDPAWRPEDEELAESSV